MLKTEWGVQDSETFVNFRSAQASCGQLQVADGEPASAPASIPAACAALLVACDREGTGADPVVKALANACNGWALNPNAKRLRSALIEVLSLLG